MGDCGRVPGPGHLPGLGRTQNNLLVHPVPLVLLLLPASGHHAQASVGNEGARCPSALLTKPVARKMVPELRLPSAGEL